MNRELEFEDFKNIYSNIFDDIDLKQFEEIKKEVQQIIDLKQKIKELAKNENKYYILIIEKCIELLKENNSDWFRYFRG